MGESGFGFFLLPLILLSQRILFLEIWGVDWCAMWLLYALLMVLGWSLAIVFDSLLVRHYEKNPFILMWTQSCFSMLFLVYLSPLVVLEPAWMPLLAVGAVIAYFGDLVFFLAIDRMDASVFNIAWAILAVLLGIAGFFLFGESWTLTQALAALCILAGIIILSYWHRHITPAAFGLLVLLAFLYAPGNVVQKMALNGGVPLLTMMFWFLLFRECTSFTFHWCMPRFRRLMAHFIVKVDFTFVWITGFVVATYFLGVFFAAHAFAAGPISLIAVVGNVQPFLVLFLAWVLFRIAPLYASRELLDWQSVRVKLVSFCVVFVGMMLLAV